MAIYKFRAVFEEDEDVYRDIELRSSHTLNDLHLAILNAIGYDNKQETILYKSDTSWHRDNEIAVIKGNDPDNAAANVKLARFIDDPHQRFLYLFDPIGGRYMYVELLKVLPETPNVTYPRCVKSVGISPPQYKLKKIIPPVALADHEEEHEPVAEQIFVEEQLLDSNEEDAEGNLVLEEETVGDHGGGEDESGSESEEGSDEFGGGFEAEEED